MWHNKVIEGAYIIITIAIIVTGSALCVVLKPETPITFPYAQEYPIDLILSDTHLSLG